MSDIARGCLMGISLQHACIRVIDLCTNANYENDDDETALGIDTATILSQCMACLVKTITSQAA